MSRKIVDYLILGKHDETDATIKPKRLGRDVLK